jgi:hypothetical protein
MQSIETWIRLETGDVVGAVMLNRTYNGDWYSATPNTHTHPPDISEEFHQNL